MYLQELDDDLYVESFNILYLDAVLVCFCFCANVAMILCFHS